MKITINPTTGEMSLDIDPQNQKEVEQAMAITMGLRNGHSDNSVHTSLVFAEDDDDELSPEDLIAPSNTAAVTSAPVTEDERIAARLRRREQLETWLYLRRHDRVRGVSLTGLARRFKLSSSAASTRCNRLVKSGYAIRISRGFYRAVVPEDN